MKTLVWSSELKDATRQLKDSTPEKNVSVYKIRSFLSNWNVTEEETEVFIALQMSNKPQDKSPREYWT